MELGNDIKNARIRARLTQRELAEVIGIDQGNVSRMENNQWSPTVKTLERVAKATKTKLVILFD